MMGTPFWQSKEPALAYIAALQKSAGIPSTGIWNLPSHQALYTLAHKFNPEVSEKTPWGAEPAKTAEYVVGIVNDDDMTEEMYATLRPLLLDLGFPMLSYGDAAAWVENRSEEEAAAITNALKAVAEAVGQAESRPLPAPAAAPPPANQTVAPGTTPPAPQVQATAPVPGTAGPVVGAPNGGPAPNGVPVALATTTGMSRGKKIAIGVGITLAALLAGALAWKALKKDEPKTEFVGSRNRKGGFGCDCG